MSSIISRRRSALFVSFLLLGISMASWITRTPAIRDSTGASTAEMGLILFGLSVGSMTGILASGPLVARFGTRPIAIAGLWFVVAAMGIIGISVALGSMWIAGLGLASIGLGMGIAEIAINIDGADVERVTDRPLLHTLHGCYSLGTLVGAFIGFGMTSIGFPVLWHLSIIAVLDVILILWFMRFLAVGIGREDRTDAQAPHHAGGGTLALLADVRLLLIGLIVLGMALAEGAANDWLPILMVDGYGFSQASGSLIFVGFATAMTVGRFSGGWFLDRYGRTVVIRTSAVLGAIGIATVIFASHPVVGAAAVLLWGLGASLGFPVALSAAAQSGSNPAGRVRIVATGGYFAFLVGPPFLGFIGEHYGLRMAMVTVLSLVVIAALIASAVGARKTEAGA